MEEGSLRCDVNISVRKKGDEKLGTKVEIKNLNSIRNAKRAVEHEAARLINMLEHGEEIIQQTRSFDADKGTTFAIRVKEDADDYRYFADPDLPPFQLSDDFIESIKKKIPALQEERIKKYTTDWQLPGYDAGVLTEDKTTADYFEEIVKNISNYKAASNWMIGPVRSWLNENNLEINAFPLLPKKMASLVRLVEDGKVSFSSASTKLFQHLLQHPEADPEKAAIELNLIKQSDQSELEPLINEVLEKFAEKVKEYKKGKKGLLSLFVGEVMKRSKGKADPAVTNELLLEKLKA
jgi:aspartyl-tRNA(Asn)/glutamyl-tRNA(Gln) amidotransferase subunit B